MSASFKDQQEACGFNVAGIEGMKRAVLASPVTMLNDNGATTVVSMQEAIRQGMDIQHFTSCDLRGICTAFTPELGFSDTVADAVLAHLKMPVDFRG